MKKKYEVTGMMCAACQANVTRTVQRLDGVENVNVSLLAKNMVVEFDPAKQSDETIIQAVEKAGYGCSIFVNATLAEIQKKRIAALHKKRNRLIASLLLLVVLMVFSMTPMFLGESFMKRDDYVALMIGDIAIQFALFIPIGIINRDLFLSGFKALFHGKPNMQSLVSCGTAASLAYGVYCFIMILVYFFQGRKDAAMSYTMNIYVESASMIPVFVSLGKYFEASATTKTTSSIARLMALTPETAYRMENGEAVEVSTDSLQEEDVVMVKPGTSIPTDGVIVEGHGSIDESALTGESVPVEKNPGAKVIGGTINHGDAFLYRVTSMGKDSTMGKIIAMVEEASESKAPLARLADRVSLIFCPTVLILSLLVFILWEILTAVGVAGTTHPDTNLAIQLGISVMVISCPCALGLATPVAIMVGTGKGAENGILIKSATAFEQTEKIDAVLFDKTGTLTTGQMAVDKAYFYGGEKEKVLASLGSVECCSEHPLSKALVRYVKEQNVSFAPSASFVNCPGKGVKDEICLVGNSSLMTDFGIDCHEAQADFDAETSQGKTVIFMAVNQHLVACFSLMDKIKDGAEIAIKNLQKLGKKIVIVTGDNKKTAEFIGQKLGVDRVYSEILPQDKATIVASMQEEGMKVAMVGDGVNDALALTKADVGIAIGAGTDVAIDSADIVLVRSDPYDVYSAVLLSRAVVRNIKQNLTWAFLYNILLIPLAAGAFYGITVPANWFTGSQTHLVLTPMIGSMTMSISSVTVVLNALRLKRFHSRCK